MHSLRLIRFAIRRKAWLGEYHFPNYKNQVERSCGQRRRFSESAGGSSSVSTTLDGKELERFAFRALRVPLGAMNNKHWEVTARAIDYWCKIGGGYSTHSADKLLQRLKFEHAVLNRKNSSFEKKTSQLINLQKLVLQSWLDVHRSNKNSQLALVQAENGLKAIMPSGFPVLELLEIVDSWLDLQTRDGATSASNLLLDATDDQNFMEIASFASEVGPRFTRAARLLSESLGDLAFALDDGVSLRLLERMQFLKESTEWQNLEIPEPLQKILLEETFFKEDEYASLDEKKISSFEAEALENRIIELLEMSGEGDIVNVQKIVAKLTDSPSREVILSLIDFFLRVGDSENSSQWLQAMDEGTWLSLKEEQSTILLEKVLEVWSQDTSLRTPWRADETFERILGVLGAENAKVIMNADIFNGLFKIWVASKDSAASRKIQEWYPRMTEMNIKPDSTSLHLLFQASAMNEDERVTEACATYLLDRWIDLSASEKLELAERAIGMLSSQRSASASVVAILDRLKESNLQPSHGLNHASLQAIRSGTSKPSDVMELLKRIEESGGTEDLSVYKVATQALFQFEATGEIDFIVNRVIDKVKKEKGLLDSGSFGEFLTDVVAMQTRRKRFQQAENTVFDAEKELLSSTPGPDEASPIPLNCYRQLINRGWYTEKTAPKVVATFQHLFDLYSSGYSDLRPDSDIFLGYIRALAVTVDGAAAAERGLVEMLQLFEVTGDDSCKPDAAVWDTVLLAYGKNAKSDLVASKSLLLFEDMLRRGIKPTTKTINYLMRSVIKRGGKDTYSTVVELFENFQKHDLEPDSFSLHFLADACSFANVNKQGIALKTCLETIGKIREKNEVNTGTYGILTKALRFIAPTGPNRDKVACATFMMCCEDGQVTKQVKENLQAIMSEVAWRQIYTGRLSENGEEPGEWSRNRPSEPAGEVA